MLALHFAKSRRHRQRLSQGLGQDAPCLVLGARSSSHFSGDTRPVLRPERSAVTAPVPVHSSTTHSPPPWPRAAPAPGTRGAPAPGPRSPSAHPRPQRPGRPPAGHRAAALRLGRGASRGPPPGPVRGQRSRGGRTRSPTAAPRLGLHACPPAPPRLFLARLFLGVGFMGST